MSSTDPGPAARNGAAGGPPRRLLLIASSGGHIFEMFCLRDFWGGKDRAWVSFPTADARYLLADEKEVHWAAHPTVRNVPNLLRNLVLAWRLLRTDRPDMILTTGSGVAAPFLWLARLLGIPTVFVESITRITEISLTARLVKPFATCMLVQWPELVDRYPGVEHHGRIV
jgi:beta-1,4-N-acetylglucosaminyltransferase